MSKTADRLILRPEPGDSPGSASTGETPLRKMSKAVAPRDTKLLFGNPSDLGILFRRTLDSRLLKAGLFRET
ncbi:MAG TPA: hypothetical protein VEL71_05160 [Candidatus Dormibacteraeota bacterium]|nr:hypothetical protein [Candidatus Dormibacteraeota bacterium]